MRKELHVFAVLFFALTSSPSASDPYQQAKEFATTEYNWLYQSSTDDMRGVQNSWATTTSTNTHKVGAFNDKKGKLKIIVRRMPETHGLDVLLSLDDGQIHCGYSGCSFSAKFDDGPILKYTASKSADSNRTIFVHERKAFIEQLASSSDAIIEVHVWKNGLKQFKFRTAGLDW